MADIYDVECGLCLTEETDRLIKCQCGYYTCFECQHMMKKLYCPNCNTEVVSSYIHKLVSEDNPIAIDHYISKYYQYDPVKENDEFQKKLNIANIEKIIFSRNEKKEKVTFVGRCVKCNSPLIKHTKKNKCIKCDYSTCSFCEEVHPEDVPCNKDTLENLKLLQSTSRKCPGCFSYVCKIEGCDHMRCLACGTQFSWNSGLKQIRDYGYLEERDKKVIYKPGSRKTYNLEVVKIEKTPAAKKKTMLTNHVTDFIEALKNKLNNNINTLKKNLSIHIKKEYGKQNEEVNYENILSNIPIIHKKKLFENIIVLEYISSFDNDDFKKELFVAKYNESELPARYKIAWEEIMTYITSTTVVNKTEGEFAKNTKDDIMKPISKKQEIHIGNIIKRIKDQGTCVDTSPAGSGKTYTALLSAVELKIKKIMILCPVTMKPKWTEVISSHKQTNKMEFLIKQYTSLIITSLKKSGLIRMETVNEKIIFHLSDSLKEWLKDNSMIIIDESHNSKSSSSVCFKFISALTAFAFENGIPCISMSATPTSSVNDSLNYIKKYIPVNESYNKRLITSFPRFERFVYSTEEDKNPYVKKTKENKGSSEDIRRERKNKEECFPSLDLVLENKGKLDKTYIYDRMFRPDMSTRRIEYFGLLNNNISENFERPEILEIIKIVTILENHYDLRSGDFWENNFYDDEFWNNNDKNKEEYFKGGLYEQEILLSIDQDVLKNDLDILNTIHNSTFRFNCIFIYFLTLYTTMFLEEEKKNNRDQLYINIRRRRFTSLEEIKNTKHIFYTSNLVKFFFFLYGIPLKHCTDYVMKQVDKEKLISLLLKKYIVNIKEVSEEDEDYIDHEKNLCLYNLELEMSQEDNQRINKVIKDFVVEDEDKIIQYSVTQIFSRLIFNLQITESISANYVYDIVKAIKNDKRNIVVAFNYNNTLDVLKERCKTDNINYDLINGSVKNKQAVIDDFQKGCGKLLFINMASLNSGVDLDDKKGDSERFVFIVPNYNITKLTQFMFRFQRVDSKSNSKVFMISNQRAIISSMNEKLNFLKGFESSFSCLDKGESIYTKDAISRFASS